jgi:hypothetical protein
MVQSHPRQIVHNALSQKNPSQKKGLVETQGVDPEVKSQYHKTKQKKAKGATPVPTLATQWPSA